jgi:hypothetical protein
VKWWVAATLPVPWMMLLLGSLAAILLAPAVQMPFPTLYGTVESVAAPALLALGPAAAWSRVRTRRDAEALIAPVRRTVLRDLGFAFAPCVAVCAAAGALAGPRAALVPLLAATAVTLISAVRFISGLIALLPTGWTLVSLLAGERDGVVAWWALPLVDEPAPVALAGAGLLLVAGAAAFVIDSR